MKQKVNKDSTWLLHLLIKKDGVVVGVDSKMIESYFKTEIHEGHTFIFHQPKGWKNILVSELKTGGVVKRSKTIIGVEEKFNDWKRRRTKVQLVIASVKCRNKLKSILKSCQENQ